MSILSFDDFLNESADVEIPIPNSLKNLPKHPNGKNVTKKQIDDWVDFLSKKPLKDLRKRQDLVSAQLSKAFANKNDEALESLGFIENLLIAAIDKKEFGD